MRMLLLGILLATASAHAEPRFLRFPDVSGHQLVFSYAGDLWLSTTAGGTATPLATGPGLKLFPKFSPDGKWVAFTAQYGGDEQVYVVPAGGGRPRQLTFFPARGPLTARQGYDNQVDGWSPDGKYILFRSLRDEPNAVDGRLYEVPLSGGPVVALPPFRAGKGVFSPDGTKLLYSPISRDFHTWKHYHGGMAEDQFILDLNSRKLTNITVNPYTDRDPMWNDSGIFFMSDRDGRMNLYRYDGKPGAATQLTHFTDVDAKFASSDRAGHIVYEVEGTLHYFDPNGGGDRALTIDVPAEDWRAAPRTVGVSDQVEQAQISPGGHRAAIVARGDVYVQPTKPDGAILNLTHSSNAHEREVAWSRDGRTIAYISDASGEEELWVIAADGAGTARQITHGNHKRFYRPKWAPDGRHIVMCDDHGNLVQVDMASGAQSAVGTTRAWDALDYDWSPDSRYIAYAQIQATNFRAINIWDSVTGKTVMVTDPMYDSFTPSWSPDGRFLWFLSVRDANLLVPDTEWNFAPNRQTRIYGLALRHDVTDPFASGEGDEHDQAIAITTGQHKPRGGQGAGKAAADPSDVGISKGGGDNFSSDAGSRLMPVQFDGIESRLVRVPLEAGNYSGLVAYKDGLVFDIQKDRYFGATGFSGELVRFDLKTAKQKTIRDDVGRWSASLDGRSLLVRNAKRELTAIHEGGEDEKMDMARLKTQVYPRQEWAEIFGEAWRRYRTFFYDPNMHGRNWTALGAHYRALLPGIGDRADLDYLIGEMVAELNVGHAYIAGGKDDVPARPKTGLLGARLHLDTQNGAWRFEKIFAGQDADPAYRSPLTEFSTRVEPGESLLAIDGQLLTADTQPYALLAGKADSVVDLLIGAKDGSRRTIRIKTLSSEASLIRMAQIQQARATVDRLSGGRIGYVHISDMSPDGLKEFVKDWYGQLRKDGMVVDIRGNQGGNVSRMILERLIRKAYTRGYVQGLQVPQTYPWGDFTQVFLGEMDLLVNETTVSDGDTESWTFGQTGRGKLVGRKTWGGVIGIGDSGPLLDGGLISVPQYALSGPDGHWIVEGEGVTPDIEVDNDQPYLEDGRDAQLIAAVKDLQSRIKGHPGEIPPEPPVPPKP